MTSLDLSSFVARSQALLDSTPPSTRRETRAWLVDPLLETLGWKLQSDACRFDTTVDGTRFEYVLTVESIPALLVAVESASAPLDRDRTTAICHTMARTGIDRALYTNGRHLLLLAGTDDIEPFHCELHTIVDHESTLAHYTNDRITTRLQRHSRRHVGRQLAVERQTLQASIVDQLTAVSGPSYEGEFAAATDRFLDRLVASFTGQAESVDTDVVSKSISTVTAPETEGDIGHAAGIDDGTEADDHVPDAVGSESETQTIDENPEIEPTGEPATAATETAEEGRPTREGDTNDDEDGQTDRPASDDEDGQTDQSTGDEDEYVVRFFNGSTSIGAIGYSSSERALVHAAEYCFERGLSGVEVPWGPDDETILNEGPVHADGTPMDATEQLSNGLVLNTAGGVSDHATRVEALASRAGLRAMLTGDW